MQAFAMCYDKLTEEKRTEKINSMRSATSYMTKLLDDILIVGKMYTGKLKSVPTKINLEEFCNNIIEDFEITNEKNQNLAFWTNNSDYPIVMDEMLLRKIITNLLSNAIKYSPEGGDIELKIGVWENNKLSISIKDEGTGIPESDQKYIFEPFHLGENALMNQGVGMGLAIVKEAVEALHGDITFESILNKGTIFTVSLPLI